MNTRYEPRLARIAAMIADPARSRMLAYLLDGHRASAGELADAASVVASTASGHLAKLVEAGLVALEPRGRHRYFRLADAEVAHALESLALLAERGGHERLWDSPARRDLRQARCCYGHLAGALGVELLDGLLRAQRLVPSVDGFALTDAGTDWLRSLGISLPGAGRRQRLAYPCLDWSERRDHLAGALAAALLEHFIASGWLASAHAPGASAGAQTRNRALQLTVAGRTRLLPMLADA